MDHAPICPSLATPKQLNTTLRYVQLRTYLRRDQQLYLTAGMPTRSHSPLEVYLPRSPDELRLTRSIWRPLYVQEPNLSGQRCTSNGKNVTSMRQELFVIAGTTHNTGCHLEYRMPRLGDHPHFAGNQQRRGLYDSGISIN